MPTLAPDSIKSLWCSVSDSFGYNARSHGLQSCWFRIIKFASNASKVLFTSQHFHIYIFEVGQKCYVNVILPTKALVTINCLRRDNFHFNRLHLLEKAPADCYQPEDPCFHCQWKCAQFVSATSVMAASPESTAHKSAAGLLCYHKPSLSEQLTDFIQLWPRVLQKTGFICSFLMWSSETS